jgi:hypothetical protein
MASPRIILGRIVEVNGTTPGPASGITYTIACHDPQVDGPFRVTNQRPIRRWPDALDTVAFAVGSMVVGVSDATILQWHSMEMPDFGACPDNSGGSQLLQLLRSGGAFGPLGPIAPGSGSTEAGGGNDSPAGPIPGSGSTD